MKRIRLFMLVACLSLTMFPLCRAEDAPQADKIESSQVSTEDEENAKKAGVEKVEAQDKDKKNEEEIVSLLKEKTTELMQKYNDIPSYTDQRLFAEQLFKDMPTENYQFISSNNPDDTTNYDLYNSIKEKAQKIDPLSNMENGQLNKDFLNSLTPEETNFLTQTVKDYKSALINGLPAAKFDITVNDCKSALASYRTWAFGCDTQITTLRYNKVINALQRK